MEHGSAIVHTPRSGDPAYSVTGAGNGSPAAAGESRPERVVLEKDVLGDDGACLTRRSPVRLGWQSAGATRSSSDRGNACVTKLYAISLLGFPCLTAHYMRIKSNRGGQR